MPGQSRMQQIQEMLAEMPDDVELHYMLGMEYVSQADDAGAVRCFEELLARHPNYAPAYHQAGRALQRLNRPAEARSLLQRGIEVAQAQGNLHAAGEMTELLQSLENI